MATVIVAGPWSRSLVRDKEGHRDYEIEHLVKATVAEDGPQVVGNTPGLPVIGSIYLFSNDLDAWAFCWPNMTIQQQPAKRGEATCVWSVKQKFSTRPLERCQDNAVEDPLLEPQKVSGSFVRYTTEAKKDRNGNAILTTSHELIHGPQVEFDNHRPTVVIEQNVAALGLETFSDMVDTVNDANLWGMGPRKVKMSAPTWSRKLYGLCNFYFTRRFEFQIDAKTFDRDDILNEGTKALGDRNPTTGAWVVAGDVANPDDFNRYQDKKGNVARVLLAADGSPLGLNDDPIPIPLGTVEKYEERNFLLLGIPTNLEAV